MQTLAHAEYLAEVAVEILFSGGDPFDGKVDRVRLQKEIRQATLVKLVTQESDLLEESEFQQCLAAARVS